MAGLFAPVARSADSSLSDESLFRAVLDLLGLKRLAENACVVLSSAMELADLTGPEQRP